MKENLIQYICHRLREQVEAHRKECCNSGQELDVRDAVLDLLIPISMTRNIEVFFPFANENPLLNRLLKKRMRRKLSIKLIY